MLRDFYPFSPRRDPSVRDLRSRTEKISHGAGNVGNNVQFKEITKDLRIDFDLYFDVARATLVVEEHVAQALAKTKPGKAGMITKVSRCLSMSMNLRKSD